MIVVIRSIRFTSAQKNSPRCATPQWFVDHVLDISHHFCPFFGFNNSNSGDDERNCHGRNSCLLSSLVSPPQCVSQEIETMYDPESLEGVRTIERYERRLGMICGMGMAFKIFKTLLPTYDSSAYENKNLSTKWFECPSCGNTLKYTMASIGCTYIFCQLAF